MNLFPRILCILLCASPVFAESITLLNGETHTGNITLTDNYTLKISSPSGIVSLPLASLSESDLERLTVLHFGISASQYFSEDPRFWYERRAAYLAAIMIGVDLIPLTALQAEIDANRDLIARYKDELVEKDRARGNRCFEN